ncbi:RNA methyltransferase [Candidatus Sumerlaeota bacterium]|nr:RNA methyltransferase [Candidatus Sumerlaeota bacterium]
MALSIALVHYPVRDKRGDIAATSITNFDIHDLARTARTYGVEPLYIISPMNSQKEFARRIIRHWSEGFGSCYNPSRKTALETTLVINDLGEILEDFETRGIKPLPLFVGTSARNFPNTISFKALRERIEKAEENFCIVFGTGWGLHPSLLQDFDLTLEPIKGAGPYNHLSVRSAVAIICDRLMGR